MYIPPAGTKFVSYESKVIEHMENNMFVLQYKMAATLLKMSKVIYMGSQWVLADFNMKFSSWTERLIQCNDKCNFKVSNGSNIFNNYIMNWLLRAERTLYITIIYHKGYC